MGDSEYEQVLIRGRAALHEQVDALLGTKKREGRKMTAAENERFYALMDLIVDLDNILDIRAERRRQADIKAGKPVPPRPETIVVRRIGPPLRKQRRTCRKPRARIRRAAPLVARTRTRRGEEARASPRKAAADPEPPGPPLSLEAEGASEGILADDHVPPWIAPPAATAIARLAHCDLWAWLRPQDRREIIARINFGLSRADSQWIAELLQQASHLDGWHWPILGEALAER
jgi:hypothetical protein